MLEHRIKPGSIQVFPLMPPYLYNKTQTPHSDGAAGISVRDLNFLLKPAGVCIITSLCWPFEEPSTPPFNLRQLGQPP